MYFIIVLVYLTKNQGEFLPSLGVSLAFYIFMLLLSPFCFMLVKMS
jgi:hypothetical protein